MSIVQHPFGVTKAGEQVMEYVVANEQGYGFTAISYGGFLTSVRVPDREGGVMEVGIGSPDFSLYEEKKISIAGALIGRVGNRIAGASFDLDGKHYELAKTNGENNVHSRPLGFDSRVWKVTPVEPCSLRLQTVAEDGESGFPGRLEVEVVYTYTEDNRLVLHYHARTDKTTLCNLTNHVYFNLSGEENILGHELQIHAPYVTEVNDVSLVPTGRLQPVEEVPYNFSRPVLIGDVIARLDEDEIFAYHKGVDFNYCAGRDRETKCIATLYSPKSGIEMKVITDQPGVQVYTGMSFNADGRDGKHYGMYAGVALETQHYPDAPHHPEFPSIVLRPQDVYDTETSYCFSIRS